MPHDRLSRTLRLTPLDRLHIVAPIFIEWRLMKRVLLATLVCLACSSPLSLLAQTNYATLGGTVGDSSGALIPGVTITARNIDTGIVTTVLSNETGAYQFAALQPGKYRVSAELPGFRTSSYDEVTLGLTQQVRLNFTLQVGAQTEAVEVTATADTLIATTSASVGSVLTDQKVKDLPLPGRNVLDLLTTTPGAGYGAVAGGFAGGRVTAVNVTRDGINVQDGRYAEAGAYSTTFVSPDLVEEIRIIVAPADAETGRGSGQVQLLTRSGTNQYRGSLFWTNRNSRFDANSFFNNLNGVRPDFENRNQFGGRLGGPIIKNKTFFFFLFDGQRYLTKQNVTGTVLTAQARQGIFRFFPGVQNQNAAGLAPTVDALGNPVKPGPATPDLQSINIFGRDPLRPTMDPSGWVQKVLAKMPLPNNFRTGDGLNTAGILWQRRLEGNNTSNGTGPNTNRNTHNFRVDHSFSQYQKFFFSGTIEKSWSTGAAVGIPIWPGGYDGLINQLPRIYTASLVSTLSPTVLNELRVGYRKSSFVSWGSFERPDDIGKEAAQYVLTTNGLPYLPKTILYAEHFLPYNFSSTRASTSPVYDYVDTLSWNKGKHAFKLGGEVRFQNSNGWNSDYLVPYVFLGAGAFPVVGLDPQSVPGMVAQNQTVAQQILLDLSGSVDSIRQGFSISGSKDPVFLDYRDQKQKRRDYHQRDWSVFVKDDWKVTPSLTLNVGVRYEYFGVPWEAEGLVGGAAGGNTGLYGISAGALTTVQLVGKNSANPEIKLHRDDWNNFGPAMGLSWQVPWFGKDKTVLRAGYGINYNGAPRFNQLDTTVGTAPGTNLVPQPIPPTFTNLTNVASLLPVAKTLPLQPISLTDRTQNLFLFDTGYVRPYIQNFNIEIQRELARNLTLEARYVGTKGTRLYAGVSLNEVNIFDSGILEAFNATRSGGNAPLFDRMLMGLNVPGFGVVNGTTLTGSAALRQNTATRSFIANGNVGALANYLNTNPFASGVPGGLLRNARLPDNLIVANPQFLNVEMNTNPGSSTYHSLVTQVTKRFSHGFTNQLSYTWSRSLGEFDSDGARITTDFSSFRVIDPKNRRENKTLVNHRTHDIRSNGTWQLPFGPQKKFLGNSSGIVARLVERWQLGGIFSWNSGAPLTILSGRSTITGATTITPDIVGDFPKSSGGVVKVQNGVSYFSGLKQAVDPDRNSVTTLQSTQGSFTGMAITDANGRLLLENSPAGRHGTMGLNWIEGPSNLGLDMNLIKRMRIDEAREFEFRLDALNILNHPNFGNPALNINQSTFGRITTATGNRTFVANLRLNF
jgi:hypothetical protein